MRLRWKIYLSKRALSDDFEKVKSVNCQCLVLAVRLDNTMKYLIGLVRDSNLQRSRAAGEGHPFIEDALTD
jgi:hypothetical protein